jgi:hypothetical protein
MDLTLFHNPVIYRLVKLHFSNLKLYFSYLNIQSKHNMFFYIFTRVISLTNKMVTDLAKRNFFFQNLSLGYITKTLNQIIFFSLCDKHLLATCGLWFVQ